jgi:monoamine oxidase
MTTRRELILRFGAVAGVAGAYAAMHGLGLTGSDVAWAGMPNLPQGSGKGARVVILGAGAAGMSAAYELGKAGYDCTVLEARGRTGGRAYSIRKGNVLEMDGRPKQMCAFSEGMYFNAGAGRIPTHHLATLGYCRELGVATEVEVNMCNSAFIQSDRVNDAKPITLRQAIYDYRGHVAELLAKCGQAGALDQQMSHDDRDKLIEGLKNWGSLTEKLAYEGSESAGLSTYAGAGDQAPVHVAPMDFNKVSDPFVLGMACFADAIDMQATMQQPIGGMDRIHAAFQKALGKAIRLHSEVRAIRRKGAGVAVTYADTSTGKTAVAEADYCICTIPFSVLSGIANDFSPDRQAAIKRNAKLGDGYKVAFQGPRFWEQDDRIFGGLSFTERDTLMTWYPSDRLNSDEGVVVAGYAFDGKAGARDLPGQYAYGRETMEKLHPGRSHLLHSPMAIQWSRVKYSQGAWLFLAASDPDGYKLMSDADGPFYFAGEHLSQIPAWQQGAFASAHRVVGLIAARQKARAA